MYQRRIFGGFTTMKSCCIKLAIVGAVAYGLWASGVLAGIAWLAKTAAIFVLLYMACLVVLPLFGLCSLVLPKR